MHPFVLGVGRWVGEWDGVSACCTVFFLFKGRRRVTSSELQAKAPQLTLHLHISTPFHPWQEPPRPRAAAAMLAARIVLATTPAIPRMARWWERMTLRWRATTCGSTSP